MANEICRKSRKLEKEKHKTEENGNGPDGSSGLAFSGGNWDGEYVKVIESTVKKRKSRKKNEEEMVEDGHLQFHLQDPLMVLGFDIMHVIFTLLDARSVALSLLVSRGWYGVACSDRLWSPKCKELWLGKAHIPHISKVRGLSKLEAYSLSAMDSKRIPMLTNQHCFVSDVSANAKLIIQIRITRDDLCDHVWDFHFRENAPVYWRNLDPYWKGTGQLMHRYFHQDGSQTADPGDKVWGGHEACYSVVTGLEADGKIRDHYVRINRRPSMSVSRKQDWSWEMSNRFCNYSSIPDSDKDDGTGPLFLVM